VPGIEGYPATSAFVILACTNQNSIWDTCNDTEGTPCDDTVLRWLHTLNRQWREVVANLLLARLAMTIFDPDRSRTVSIDFIDNPYHGEHHAEKRRTLFDGLATGLRPATATARRTSSRTGSR